MNPFTTHTRQQGVTYIEHAHFAIGIAKRLFINVIVFTAHALLPFIPIKPEHDLEATIAFLKERNEWIEMAKRTSGSKGTREFSSPDMSQIRV